MEWRGFFEALQGARQISFTVVSMSSSSDRGFHPLIFMTACSSGRAARVRPHAHPGDRDLGHHLAFFTPMMCACFLCTRNSPTGRAVCSSLLETGFAVMLGLRPRLAPCSSTGR